MNDPNRRIDIDKSSLLSLKAELLRKQEEVNKAKPFRSIEDHVPKRSTKQSEKSKPDGEKPRTLNIEDVNLLNKSKRVLEAKAKYYERMAHSGGTLNTDENCLVMFNQKRQEQHPMGGNSSRYSESSEDDDYDNEQYESNDPENDWVEYTDCLGRTRKCLKKDLDDFQKRDKALEVAAELQNTAPPEPVKAKVPSHHSDDELEEGEVIGPYMLPPQPIGETFLKVREQWEEQEVKNIQKDFVHYQDVLFDEARDHGVGYYQFSSDDAEREKQQKELNKIRASTLNAQNTKDEIRKTRDKIIADRVKAAKARQRARLGLPPEEEDSAEKKVEDELYDKTQELERKQIEEMQQKEREEEEAERDRQRKSHIRPWDKDKEKSDEPDEDWIPTREREPMSQQQWNEHKREERNLEFAPVAEPNVKKRPYVPKPIPKPDPPANWYQDRPPPQLEDAHEATSYREESKSLFFSSKKPEFKRRNYVETEKAEPFQPTPIHNELLDDFSKPPPERRGIEIPPPPGCDDYGPPAGKSRRTIGPDIETSIAAGLKFLREQSDKDQYATKNTWTSKADY